MDEQNSMIWMIDPVHTRLRFGVRYLMLTAVSGWFTEFEGSVITKEEDFSACEIRLTIYANSIYTGNEERDNHLRSADFFDTKRYPTIGFRSTSVTAHADHIQVNGELTIKDVTQPIGFNVILLGLSADPMGNSKAGFEMDAVFNRQDFKISWNQVIDKFGVMIADEVKLHGDVQLLRIS
ncbi:YceI family protein [Terrimonas sp. NA20]|uniref:YceI family protein n=1 Tax=Terrimonas ginsenosidimutans TaxID=2908004 RepID=A0ABS9KYP5_9BACT|nr:YceI family protein [Terrimonas ginsenosidimutans]MCG2617438.1 YceI family protein [Terrimonas ginsenosidimutans]